MVPAPAISSAEILAAASHIHKDALITWYSQFVHADSKNGLYSPTAKDKVRRDVNEHYRGRYDGNFWPRTGPGPPAPTTTNSTNVIPDMHRHNDTLINNNDSSIFDVVGACLTITAYELGRDPSVPAHPALKEIQAFLSVYRAACHIRMIHRFLSSRQAKLLYYPYLDGAILDDPRVNPENDLGVKYEYHFRRHWLRLLHYPGLLKKESNDGRIEAFDQFSAIYGLSRLLLEAELDKVGLDPEEYLFRADANEDEDFNKAYWVECFALDIERIINEVIKWASLGLTGSPNQLTPEQKVANRRTNLTNLDASVIVAKRIKRELDTQLGQRPFARLLIELINLECEFETALGETHVEDKMFEKQISILDEVEFVKDDSLPTLFIENTYQDIPNVAYYSEIIRRSLKDAGMVNLQRRNFRMLRDMKGERPFNNLYQLYDSRLEGREWLRDPISDFQTATLTYIGKTSGIPSSYSRMLNRMFLFAPIDLGNVQDAEFIGRACGICRRALSPDMGFDSSIAQLFCDPESNCPKFHLKCIYAYWDMEGIYVQRCPICRAEPRGGVNYKYYNIVPREAPESFVHNLWGWYGESQLDRATGAMDLSRVNVPSEPPAGEIPRDDNEEANYYAQQYWANENRHILAVEEAYILPIGKVDFLPPSTLRDRKRKFRLNRLELQQTTGLPDWDPNRTIDKLMRRIFKTRMEQQFPLGERELQNPVLLGRSLAARVPNLSTGNTLRRVRMQNPVTETVWLRHLRRRRDRAIRMEFARRGVGLTGLGRRFQTGVNQGP